MTAVNTVIECLKGPLACLNLFRTERYESEPEVLSGGELALFLVLILLLIIVPLCVALWKASKCKETLVHLMVASMNPIMYLILGMFFPCQKK